MFVKIGLEANADKEVERVAPQQAAPSCSGCYAYQPCVMRVMSTGAAANSMNERKFLPPCAALDLLLLPPPPPMPPLPPSAAMPHWFVALAITGTRTVMPFSDALADADGARGGVGVSAGRGGGSGDRAAAGGGGRAGD